MKDKELRSWASVLYLYDDLKRPGRFRFASADIPKLPLRQVPSSKEPQ